MGVLKGIDFMHNTLGTAHYDPKPDNIGHTGKIFDFGECASGLQCPHSNLTEEYTPYDYCNSTKRLLERTQTVDIFAMGVTLLEMLCGKIPNPPRADVNGNGIQAYGWKLVASKDVWKSQWAVKELKDGKEVRAAEDVETSRLIPACPKARTL